MSALRDAARKALAAIEGGASFDHLDNVVAPALRLALCAPSPAERVLDWLEQHNPQAMTCDGLDDALVGTTLDWPFLAVYDYDKAVQHHMRLGMTQEEAIEYMDFNVLGAYVGEGAPVFIQLFTEEAA